MEFLTFILLSAGLSGVWYATYSIGTTKSVYRYRDYPTTTESSTGGTHKNTNGWMSVKEE